MTRIEELRAMVAEATPGPWVATAGNDVWRGAFGSPGMSVFDRVARVEATYAPTYQGGPKAQCTGAVDANARLIAQAPTLATDLAAALEREAALREAVAPVRDALAAWQKVLRDGRTVDASITGLGDMIRVLDTALGVQT